ncbi:MAG TPA: ATP-binding protein [Polyangia bacterium]|nr:ATP-binding protein [Polyangia bacterium]
MSYSPNQELLDRLERVRLLLLRAHEVRGAIGGGPQALERFLRENVEAAFVPRSPEIDAALAQVDAHVAARAGDAPTPFSRLASLLGLDELERDLLLAALAPSARRAFREALLLLGPEVAPGVHPAAHLCELCSGSAEAFARARAALSDGGALVASGALDVVDLSPLSPPLWRAVAPSDTVRRWLDGRASPIPILDGARPLGNIMDAALAERLKHLAKKPRIGGLALIGEPGVGRTRAASALAGLLRREAAVIPPGPLDVVRRALLDARLRGRLVFVPANAERLDRALIALYASLDVPCVIAATPKSPSLAALAAAGFERADVRAPSLQTQVAAWRIGLGAAVDEHGLGDLARGHSLEFGAIETAAAEAVSQSPPDDPRALVAAAERAARNATSHKLSEVADRLSTTLSWDDLILPEETRAAVDEVWRAAAARRVVFERWGFDARTPYGRAISALFGGDPGTGKTMVATLIARELGIELYRVDLSRLVDKYIGETEKHLATLFAEAERGRCAILFDEADSLFGKRTSKGDSSTERYANMEVNYLLQRIETFSGIAILTTNQESVMDAAFKRRIRYHVNFPFPTVEERALLWKRLIPPEAPLAADVDPARLAKRYEMSGGHIKSAVLRAAFAAAAADQPLSQSRLERAADQELENLGKLVGH